MSLLFKVDSYKALKADKPKLAFQLHHLQTVVLGKSFHFSEPLALHM